MDTIWVPKLRETNDPKHIVIVQSIREGVRNHVLKPGQKLPPVRDLAYSLGVSPGTIARAYQMGVAEGMLRGETGRGTFVKESEQPKPLLEPLFYEPFPGYADLRPIRPADVGQKEILKDALAYAADAIEDATTYPGYEASYKLRKTLVDWIGPDIVGTLVADDIIPTLGAQNAVGLLSLQPLLAGPNPIILTDALAYTGFRSSARALRAQLVGVEMDQHGVRPDALIAAYRKHGAHIFLTSANVHNPTTLTVPFERRMEIAKVARSANLQVIEDDCHRISDTELPSYRALLPDNGWFVSSLSKWFSAGLRVGYIVPPRSYVTTVRRVTQAGYFGLPQILVDMAEYILNSNDTIKIRQKVQIFTARRIQEVVNVLGGWDLSWRLDAPFVLLRLPPGWRASSFAIACEREGIQLHPADVFAPENAPSVNAVRISISPKVSDEQFSHAIVKIGELLEHPPQPDPG